MGAYRETMKIVLGVLIGAGLGFALGYFGKCVSGTCPLTSDPWTVTALGAGFGFLLTYRK